MENGIMDLLKRFQLSRMRHREYRRVRAELEAYSPRELAIDLRISPSDVHGLAQEAADMHVEAFVRGNPDYRPAQGWRRHEGLGPIAG